MSLSFVSLFSPNHQNWNTFPKQEIIYNGVDSYGLQISWDLSEDTLPVSFMSGTPLFNPKHVFVT